MCHWCSDQLGSCWIEAGITIRFNFCHAKLKINKKMPLHMSKNRWYCEKIGVETASKANVIVYAKFPITRSVMKL